jgi:hypothetical protein
MSKFHDKELFSKTTYKFDNPAFATLKPEFVKNRLLTKTEFEIKRIKKRLTKMSNFSYRIFFTKLKKILFNLKKKKQLKTYSEIFSHLKKERNFLNFVKNNQKKSLKKKNFLALIKFKKLSIFLNLIIKKIFSKFFFKIIIPQQFRQKKILKYRVKFFNSFYKNYVKYKNELILLEKQTKLKFNVIKNLNLVILKKKKIIQKKINKILKIKNNKFKLNKLTFKLKKLKVLKDKFLQIKKNYLNFFFKRKNYLIYCKNSYKLINLEDIKKNYFTNRNSYLLNQTLNFDKINKLNLAKLLKLKKLLIRINNKKLKKKKYFLVNFNYHNLKLL